MGNSDQFDAYIEKQVTLALTGIEISNEKQLERLRYQIGHMLKEVERAARQLAMEKVYVLAHDINDSRPI